MPLENLLVTVRRRIGGIKIDGVITETTQNSVRVTTNPVENGVNISDHVIQEPTRYSMTGVITNSPLGAAAFTQLAGSVVEEVTGLFGQSERSGSTRSKQAYLELVALLNQKELVIVDTGLERYENLIFESIVVSADKTTSNSIHFSATFVQALIVSTARQGVDATNIDELDNSAALSSQFNSGFNATVPASSIQSSSILSSVSL